MSKLTFKRLISDIGTQDKAWRPLAQKCAEYYDHLQLTAERLQQLRDCERLDFVGNLIHPAINSVLGHEEQRRVDWMVSADDEDSEEVAEGLNQQLNEVMRLVEANRHCSEAYKHQVIKGVGWLHVRRNPDPFDSCAYIIERIDTDEIYWDMRSRDTGMRDCRWAARRKFMDKDEAQGLFPSQKELIENLYDGWLSGFSVGDENTEFDSRASEYRSAGGSHNYMQDNGERQQVAIYEVYYRMPTKVRLVRYLNGRVEEYQKESSEQLLSILTGQAKAEKASIMKMRRKYFIGPHEISDDPSQHPHNYFPFVKFEGYTEDTANTPYGLVRGMIDPQDAYNEAGFEIMHILEHKRIIKEEDSTSLRDSDLVHEVGRKDGVINVRPGKINSLVVERDWKDFQAFNGMQDKYAQQIRDFSGIYNSYSGQSSGNQSGVAIASLAELGATTLSEINANYQYARKKLAELVLAHIVHDMGDAPKEIRIRNGMSGQTKRTVRLNAPSENSKIDNRVSMARYQVTLADVHSSAGYKQHLNMRVMEMFQTSQQDPTMHRFLLEMAIETSELPRREEMLEKWRKLNGMTDDPEKQQQQLEQQMQAQQVAQQLEQQKLQLEMQEGQAKAAVDQARAGKLTMEIEKMKHDMEIQEAKAKQALVDEAWKGVASRELERV